MRIKNLKAVLALTLAVALVTPAAAVSAPVTVAQAAAKTVKLSASKKTLNVGKSFTLKLKNATGKVTWKSNKKSVATVTSKGKVKALASGKATITATNKKKTYKCTVTVKNPKKAAGMKDIQVGPVNICYPGEWNKEVASEDNTFAFVACDGENTNSSLNIVELVITPEDGSTIDDYYAMYSEITEEYLLSVLEMQGMENGKILQYSVEKCDTKCGEAVMLKQRISYYYPVTEKNYDEVKVTYILNLAGNAYVMFAANEEGDFEEAQANVDKLLETMTQL
ncbi:MAG: Ig-like domain-containing protein [bacterium]|nr:Ig-like domain-containing protein [bacterium]MDY4101004.1 Ig-like domain-containing protein [Lachnospiraceae bacterium]